MKKTNNKTILNVMVIVIAIIMILCPMIFNKIYMLTYTTPCSIILLILTLDGTPRLCGLENEVNLICNIGLLIGGAMAFYGSIIHDSKICMTICLILMVIHLSATINLYYIIRNKKVDV